MTTRARYAIAVIALLLTGQACALPYAPGQHVAPQEYATEWQWVKKRMGVSGLSQPPIIMAGNIMRFITRLEGVRALADGNMILVNELHHDDMDVISRSVLVHEFVHHVQKARGETGCGLERQAYRIQNEWLMQRGQPAYATPAMIETAVRLCEETGEHQ